MHEKAERVFDPLEVELCYELDLAFVGTAKERNINKRAVLEGRAALYKLSGPNNAHGVAQISIVGGGGGEKPQLIVNEIAGRRVYTWGMMQLLHKLASMEGCSHVMHETPDTRKRRVLARLGFVYVGENRMVMRVE